MDTEQDGYIWIQPKTYTDTATLRAGTLSAIAAVQRELDAITADSEREWTIAELPRLYHAAEAANLEDDIHTCADWFTDMFDRLTRASIAHDIEKLIFKRAGRDVTFREFPGDPSKIICFAGDRTDGDQPEGFGYRTMELIHALDLTNLFHIE